MMEVGPQIRAVEQLIGILDSVAGDAKRPVALHEPEFAGREWEYVKDCLDSGWVSSVGSYVDGFERQLAEITGARYAVAVVNGTAALHVALRVCGVQPGDEVLVPTLTFVATANAVTHCGAVPHFVDSEERSLGVCVPTLGRHLREIGERTAQGLRNRKSGRRIAAIVPMHVFGHACDMVELVELAAEWGLPIVEDAAEALGSYLHGRALGTWGRVGVLSFNGNKLVTTGGGGAVLTDSAELARRLKHLTTTAKLPHRWEFVHDEVAYNYRLPNLNAALGCAQLERLPDLLERKRRLAAAYFDAARGNDDLAVIAEPAGCRSNYWLNAVRLTKCDEPTRDAALKMVNDAGFQCRPLWRPMHRLAMYAECPRATLPVAEQIAASVINVPSSAALAPRLHDDLI